MLTIIMIGLTAWFSAIEIYQLINSKNYKIEPRDVNSIDDEPFKVEEYKDSFHLFFSIQAPNFDWFDNPYIRPSVYIKQ